MTQQTMDTSRKTKESWGEFLAYIRALYGSDAQRIASRVWALYWDGVRNSNLPDCGIWLIDRFGY